ncbi:MAG: hypothetical protein AB7H86_00595 [Blastocatellales bacterium]
MERTIIMADRKGWIACVIREYGTGLFRSCVSPGDGTSLCLLTTPDESLAELTVDRFIEELEKESRMESRIQAGYLVINESFV